MPDRKRCNSEAHGKDDDAVRRGSRMAGLGGREAGAERFT